nr:hypothetical protein [Tanacetum cinerariifolium]
MENHYMVFHLVDGVRASGVEMIYEMDFVRYFPVIHQPPQEKSIQDIEDLKQQLLDDMKSLINLEYRGEIKIDELKGNFNRMKTESNELIKSSVENLVSIPSESEDFLNIGSECDIPDCDDSQTANFSTFSNPLFDDSTSSDDESSHEEFDSLLEEFFGELAHTDLIPPGINEANYDHEEDIHLVERLLYDNSSPRPSEDFNSENFDVIIESFSPSSIPTEDSDPFMEEIDLFLASNGSIALGIDSDYSDSERDNLFLERLFHDDPMPLPDILDFSNVVRVFLPFFTYPVTSSFLLSSGSEDIIFDPGIFDYHFSSLKPGVSHQSGTFMKFNVYPNHVNESPMEILSSTCFPRDQ